MSLLRTIYKLSLTQTLRVASDQELNLTLLKLVEYLGSENEVFMALAFQEVSLVTFSRVHSRYLDPWLTAVILSCQALPQHEV